MTAFFAERWRGPSGKELREEVLGRLASGESLDDLGLGVHDGRTDLRGLTVGPPAVTRAQDLGRWTVEHLDARLELRGVKLECLDLSGSGLAGLRGFDCWIRNCRLDAARCDDWRLWATTVEHTTFASADLRGSSLGGWYEGRGNQWIRVRFARADLRDVEAQAASFVDCDFSNARLDKMDFQSSSFVRCRFVGELRDVVFWAHGPAAREKAEPNPMEDVDFSDAQLRGVAFRGLTLARVKLPTAREHLVIEHFPCVLERAVNELADSPHCGLRGLLRNHLRWVHPEQQRGVLHRADLAEALGKEDPRLAVDLLRRLERDCADR
jgi:uncharacterized protein YjbI with pentapeptide repeats